MNQDLALRVLGEIMAWSDDQAREEFKWLRLMARLKYDGYRDFQAGMRFVESLATWLQQFTSEERKTAYGFVRRRLVYIGPGEMQRLVEQFHPKIVRDRLVQIIAAKRSIPAYRVLADSEARADEERLRRQTLFMGLSDGARIDIVRHSNTGFLTNEQLVLATQLDKEKWQDLLQNLRSDLKDQNACFRLVYLIDDFAGTGTSFLRYDKEKAKWKGKLIRFFESVTSAVGALSGDHIFTPDWELCVHHYVASAAAVRSIDVSQKAAQTALAHKEWAKNVYFSFGTVLPEELPLNAASDCDKAFVRLTEKYYDPIIRTKHTDVGGVPHMGLGYGGGALPLVFEHNTPNNSVALLWAETNGGDRQEISAPPMRPLFRRRQRHA
ncbi:MAG: hypothetical protein D9V46_03815 [Deltaproteobacteria bacterium]|jgi:hypothetical protein|uniref:phosphoribosyltransferase-like protein n=1 Tax=Hydrosulfovibrio ferrireducens TaxID=2934181 RepID=UPI00121DC752|nr:MAG: hypothetical protein D9V46_03815 [Deltaproteobacteria bacterium]